MSAGKILKTIAFTATTQDHHLAVKTKSVLKWLKSGHEVRVNIQGKADRQKAMESIFKHLEKEVKNGADVKQKVVKADAIKFYLRPTPAAANLIVDETQTENAEESLETLTTGKDILSEDFEKELLESIQGDKSKSKR